MDLLKLGLGLFLSTRVVTPGGHAARQPSAFYVRKEAAPAIAVAIIPFNDLSDDQLADRKVLGLLVTSLLSSGSFTVTEPGVVDTALGDLRARGQLDGSQMKQVADKLGVSLLLTGNITEFGSSRTSSTALTVAMNARLIDASTASIVWASAVTRTGRPDDSLFGTGGTPSLSKLAQQAVDQLVASMSRGRTQIAAAMGPRARPSAGTQVAVGPSGPGSNTTGPPPGAGDTTRTPGTAPPGLTHRLDDPTEFTPDELKALLPPAAAGAQRGDPVPAGPFQTGLRTVYTLNGAEVEVKIIDHITPADALAVARVAAGEAAETQLDNVTMLTRTSSFGFTHLYLAAGRFAVYVRGPSEQEDVIRKVASAVLSGLR